MARRLNKRVWYVLISIPSDDGGFCADIFEHPAGGFGYQHFRSDAEDLGAWTPLGEPSRGHTTATAAAAQAVADLTWLTEHPRAKQILTDWLNAANA